MWNHHHHHPESLFPSPYYTQTTRTNVTIQRISKIWHFHPPLSLLQSRCMNVYRCHKLQRGQQSASCQMASIVNPHPESTLHSLVPKDLAHGSTQCLWVTVKVLCGEAKAMNRGHSCVLAICPPCSVSISICSLRFHSFHIVKSTSYGHKKMSQFAMAVVMENPCILMWIRGKAVLDAVANSLVFTQEPRAYNTPFPVQEAKKAVPEARMWNA